MNRFYMEKLIAAIRESELDAMLICPGEELNFLMGSTPMMCERFQGLVVKSDGGIFYICNLIYRGEMKKLLPAGIPVYTWFDGDIMTEKVAEIFKENGLASAVIGVNATAQAFNILELMDRTGVVFRNGKPLIEAIRMIKTPEEMQALRESAVIADRALEAVLPKIRPGMTEAEVGAMLEEEMAAQGGYGIWWIVGAGPNSSYPHYNDNCGVIRERDVLLMDFGCIYKGMYSDTTRTVFVGEPDERQKETYELVLRAQEEAEELCVTGAFVPDIDRHAREVLDEKGLAHTLINRLGHGVGYQIHEQPEIKQSNPICLTPGMAFSIEPGAYFEGDFGIRIEDIVMINEAGEREVLNKTSKKLTVICAE